MYKFPKSERLCSKIEIAKLFTCKDGFLNYPLSVKFHVNESQSPKVKLVIVSPKKYFSWSSFLMIQVILSPTLSRDSIVL